jgi:hypothetical protein
MVGRKLQRKQNLTYAGVAGLTGCVTVGIIIVALGIGLSLDARAGQRGPFTLGLLCLSVPVSLGAMTWMAMQMIKRISPPAAPPGAGTPYDDEED